MKFRRDIISTDKNFNESLNNLLKLDFLKNLTEEDFKKLLFRKTLIIGAGGVGSNLVMLLAKNNFKNISIIDGDIVEYSNLDRQIYFNEHVGEKKVFALKKIIKKINRELKYNFQDVFVNEKNYTEILINYDLIVDCSDNFKTRKLINRFCEENKKDWLYTGASRVEFSSYLFKGSKREFDKIFKNVIDRSTSEEGVLPAIPLMAAGLAFTNIVKYFLEKEIKFIKVNLWNDSFFVLK